MQYSDMQHNQMPQTFPSIAAGKRLLVKIVKGEEITGAGECFCVVEMDEPPQKKQTGVRHGANIFWDEHFLL
jgi:hypothetical protein